jgi:hypothetical protein
LLDGNMNISTAMTLIEEVLKDREI